MSDCLRTLSETVFIKTIYYAILKLFHLGNLHKKRRQNASIYYCHKVCS